MKRFALIPFCQAPPLDQLVRLFYHLQAQNSIRENIPNLFPHREVIEFAHRVRVSHVHAAVEEMLLNVLPYLGDDFHELCGSTTVGEDGFGNVSQIDLVAIGVVEGEFALQVGLLGKQVFFAEHHRGERDLVPTEESARQRAYVQASDAADIASYAAGENGDGEVILEFARVHAHNVSGFVNAAGLGNLDVQVLILDFRVPQVAEARVINDDEFFFPSSGERSHPP